MSESASPRVPAVDPRIRARRIEVQRDAGRRRLRRLGVAATVLGLAFAGWLVTRTPLLDVDTVNVTGAQHTPHELVDRVAQVAHQPMVDLDIGGIEARLERLPWVLDAHVERHFPDRVDIVITEREAVAAVSAKRSLALVDERGRVLQRVEALPAGIVAVEAPAPLPAPGEHVDDAVVGALDVAMLAGEVLGPDVRGVRVDRSGIVLTLADGASALLGATDDLAAKLSAVAAILGQVDRHCLGRIDARVASSPVLTRQEGCG